VQYKTTVTVKGIDGSYRKGKPVQFFPRGHFPLGKYSDLSSALSIVKRWNVDTLKVKTNSIVARYKPMYVSRTDLS
jgi:hypothetical protein